MRILLVEPVTSIANALKDSFSKSNIETDHLGKDDLYDMLASLGDDGFHYWALLIAADEEAPELIKAVRDYDKSVPIISLLNCRQADTIISLLNAGADDVLTKPVNGREVAARIRAVMRRGVARPDDSLTIGPLTVYLDGRDPEVHGKRIRLSAREHAIFSRLALHFGRVVPKETVYESVYGMLEAQPFEKVIDVYICKLRRKLSDATGGKQFIETVAGRGYKLDLPEKTKTIRLGRGDNKLREASPAQAA